MTILFCTILYSAALAHDLERMAMSRAEGSFDGGLEAVELLIWDERQCRACEASAVDANSAFAAEKLLAERNGERHVLLLDVARRGHVLQQRP